MSVSGFDYLLVSVILLCFFFRFGKYAREEKNEIARDFSFYALYISLSFLGIGGAGILFSQSPQILNFCLFLTVLFQTIAFAFSGKILFRILFKKISDWYGFYITLFFGIIPVIFALVWRSFPKPELPFGFINWDIPPYTGIARAILIILTQIPVGLVFFNQLSKISWKKERFLFLRTLIIGCAFFFGGIFGIGVVLAHSPFQMILVETGLTISLTFLFPFTFLKAFKPQSKAMSRSSF